MDITEDDIFAISKSTRLNALNILNKRISIQCHSVSEVLRKEIYLNCLLDQIIFAIQKGFSFNQTITLALFFKNLMDFLKENPRIELNEFILYLHDKLSLYNEFFSDSQMKQIIESFRFSILQHFELYKYSLSEDRDCTIIEDERKIICPPENFDKPLSMAKPYHIWDYEEKTKHIQIKHNNLEQFYISERARLAQDEENVKKIVEQKVEDFYDNLSEEMLSKLISSIALPILNIAGNIIKNEIDEGRETILLNIEKKSVPRPEELGPMPIYLPKSLNLSPRLSQKKTGKGSAEKSKVSLQQSGNKMPRERSAKSKK